MSEYLVVEGGELQSTSGSVSIVPGGSLFLDALKCNGNKVYSSISFTVSDPPYAGGGVLVGNSVKLKSNGFLAVLADASIEVVLAGPGGSSKPVTVSILSAGQDKVRAE